MQIEDNVDQRSWREAIGNENAGHRRGAKIEVVDDAEINLWVQRGRPRGRFPLQQWASGNDRIRSWSRSRRHWDGRRVAGQARFMCSHPDHSEGERLDDTAEAVRVDDAAFHGIVDIAADDGEGSGLDGGDDVAEGLHARMNVVVGRSAPR